MKYLLTPILILLSMAAFGQFSDDFNDGNFDGWDGNTSSFIVNDSDQLQLQGDCAAGGTNYLSVEAPTSDTATWEFWVDLTFDPSSSNLTRIYLQSSNADLTAPLNGYFIRIGEDGTNDAVTLFRQDGTTTTTLLSGTSGEVATSPTARVKVVRSTSGDWELFVDPTGGMAFVSEGTINDATYTSGNYFGFYCKYTSTRCTNFYFDDVQIGPIYVDNDPPVLLSAEVLNPTQLHVHFNEDLAPGFAETASNYSVSDGVGNPINATLDAADHSTVLLTFLEDFPEGTPLTLTVHNIADVHGNILSSGSTNFSYYTLHTYDILIDEIFPDPDPVIALPAAEYVELYNTTDLDIDIAGCVLSDGSTDSDPFPNYILPAHGYVLVFDDGNAGLFTAYTNTIAINNFPGLNNTGDNLQLFDAEGNTLHFVPYTPDWYDNAIKDDGGWSLEMIDPANPCQGDNNWTASVDPTGGTPGYVNSVNAANPDENAPALLYAYPIAADTLMLYYDEALEISMLTPTDISIDNGIGNPAQIVWDAALPQQIRLNLSTALATGIVYTVTVENVSDCSGNISTGFNTTQFGLPEPVEPGDVVINEVLFNPSTGGYDYVELHNNSDKILDLSKLIIAELNVDDETDILESGAASTSGRLLFPDAYMCATENIDFITAYYFVSNLGNFTECVLPNYPDDEGIVVLYDQTLTEIDKLHYTDDWHYALLDDKNGVSLERVNYAFTTQDEQNWHSAAADVHFGTPGYQNSDFGAVTAGGTVDLEYAVFSPDGDGYQDLLVITYATASDGFTGRFTIFDAQGRPVRALTNNFSMSREGFLTWDGITDDGTAAPMGIYIVFAELFDLNGVVEKYKKKCTLVRKN